MTVTLVTVPDVPIVSTGTYQLASGETTFSQEDLAAAVQAAADPAVPSPRIKLGHTDPRFDEAVASADFDGDPAFGTVENMRLSDDQQTIVADLGNVPDWLASTLPAHYPGRSIEGYQHYTSASGQTHRMVIKKLSLLGTTWPGITSLADLRQILEQSTPDAALASSKEAEPFTVTTEPVPMSQIAAAIDLGNVRSQFVADLKASRVPKIEGSDQRRWWARSVRYDDGLCLMVDDNDGRIIRLPFTEADGSLNYGEPEPVVRNYLPVAASASGDGQRVLASWPVRAASRPSTTPEVTTMDVDSAVLRKRLGLADDADDAAITEALNADPTPVEASAETPDRPAVPEGMTLVDTETWEQVKNGAEKGVAVAARLAQEDRDKVITAAIRAGKFGPGRREHYETLWASDEHGARETIANLAEGLIPGQEIGASSDGDSINASASEGTGWFQFESEREAA